MIAYRTIFFEGLSWLLKRVHIFWGSLPRGSQDTGVSFKYWLALTCDISPYIQVMKMEKINLDEIAKALAKGIREYSH